MIPWRAFIQQSFLAVLLVLFPAAASLAQSSRAEPARVVLKGYDPVAYFTEKRPVKGSPQISFDWDGERYHFANARHRDMFAADPDRYAPRFGGYCTGSMSRGVRNEADPQAWIISDGRLYLFGEAKFKATAEQDRNWLAVRVAAADKHWGDKR